MSVKTPGLHFIAMKYIPGVGLERTHPRATRRAGRRQVPAPASDETLVLRAGWRCRLQPTYATIVETRRSGVGEPREPSPATQFRAPQRAPCGTRASWRAIEKIARRPLDSTRMACGIIHRDVKARRTSLLDRRGDPWLLDFGLSWRRHDGAARCSEKPRACLATAQYMPPEQVCAGRRSAIDHRRRSLRARGHASMSS